jgi:3-oxoacyl-[acyl-carrier-protein] synthase II
MATAADIVITGVGVVSPLGIGADTVWRGLAAGESGIRPIDCFDARGLRVPYGGQVPGFDPRALIRPRKSLKVMSRVIQLGFVAAEQAMRDAGLGRGGTCPERFGAVMGTDMIYADIEDLEPTYRRAHRDGGFDYGLWAESILAETHPLWLLKYLPNMTASHVAIAHDARGPSNTIVLGDVSSLLAIGEAASVIRRGRADVMLAGGTSSRLHPTAIVARGEPAVPVAVADWQRVCRPFDRDRAAMLDGEGAAVFVLESRAHAEARGAPLRGRLLAETAGCEPKRPGRPPTGSALKSTIRRALARAGVAPADLGHYNAHGGGTRDGDRLEAAAVAAELGATPVTATKGACGSLGAGSGAVELAASVLGLAAGLVPPTRNYESADPDCPVNVVHGGPLDGRPGTALAVNTTTMGQVAAVVVAAAHHEP